MGFVPGSWSKYEDQMGRLYLDSTCVESIYLFMLLILLFSFLLWFLVVVVVMFAIMEVCFQFEVLVFGVVVNRASSDEHVLFL